MLCIFLPSGQYAFLFAVDVAVGYPENLGVLLYNYKNCSSRGEELYHP